MDCDPPATHATPDDCKVVSYDSDAESCGSDQVPLGALNPSSPRESADDEKRALSTGKFELGGDNKGTLKASDEKLEDCQVVSQDSDAESCGSDQVPLGALNPTDSGSPVAAVDCDSDKSKPAVLTQGHLDMLHDIYHAVCKQAPDSKKAPPAATSGIASSAETDVINEQQSVIKDARSIADFNAVGCTYDQPSGYLRCNTCCAGIDFDPDSYNKPGFFRYDSDNGLAFGKDEILPQAFRSLRGHLKCHVTSQNHYEHLETKNQEMAKHQKYFSRNQEVGLRIGRTAYHLFKEGRSLRYFESLLQLQDSNGVDLGDLNHGKTFATNLRPHFAMAIKEKITKYLSTPQESTGHRPVVNIGADKATWKHRTRQFVTATIIVPDAPNLLQVMFLGVLTVKKDSHTGYALAESIKALLDERGISGEQVAGVSVDGQYINLGVEPSLKNLYGLDIPLSWDPLHKAGLVDKHLNDGKKFDWLSSVLSVCQDLYHKFNWGQNFEHFLMAGEELDEVTINLVKTSETRFANSKRFVFTNVLRNLRVIVKCLQDIQNEGRNGKAREREKANEAASLEGRLLNATCLLQLSAAADVYQVYGHLVNVCQQVNLLPHERLEKFDAVVEVMRIMHQTCEDHTQCGEECKWPFFHKAQMTYASSGEILNIPITDNVPQRAGIGAHTTRSRDRPVEQEQDIAEAINSNASELVHALAEGLRLKVFPDEERTEIAYTKTLNNLEALYRDIQCRGPDVAAAVQWPPYLEAIRHLVHDLDDTRDSILQDQFIALCHVLALPKITRKVKQLDLDPALKKKESVSSAIISDLICSELKLFTQCKLILHSVCVAALRFGVESVVESVVSSYEHRFGQTRNVHDDTASDEMEISMNGPAFNHCKAIVSSALTSYFSKGKKSKAWHFLRTGTLFGGPSQTLSRLRGTKSKFPFLWTVWNCDSCWPVVIVIIWMVYYVVDFI